MIILCIWTGKKNATLAINFWIAFFYFNDKILIRKKQNLAARLKIRREKKKKSVNLIKVFWA